MCGVINPVEKLAHPFVEKVGVAKTRERTIVEDVKDVGDARVYLTKSLLKQMSNTMGSEREGYEDFAE